MGLSNAGITLNLDLWKNGFYKQVKQIADMGSQELFIGYDAFKNLMELYNVKSYQPEAFEALKTYPSRVSTEKFYRLLDIEEYVCTDIGGDHNSLNVDLNVPLEDKKLFNKFDMVTDFGNNEHPFNVAEAYRTMHRMCKPGGFLMIDQALFNGNGYYNFDIAFFEGLAAANDYDIIYGGYNVRLEEISKMAGWEGYDVGLPLLPELIKMFDWSKVPYIGLTYVFRKKLDQDIIFPYQSRVHIGKGNGSYLSTKMAGSVLPLRGYVPVHLKDFTFSELKSEMLGRVKNKFKRS